ncbi:DUF680 domain-containing protein [Mesorhizobium sp. B2-7-1]|uniref:DUF680 domain-containing protein n=1 Tax=Mesorhizobium sp. B2-7-1 TaxID=2589909 RepID=UPI00112AA4EC|nr:DUF680 domain-containing protein [Mesorhizobium sp. B2-7-1]TPJ61489.1 DUF680 domain-containing protein [Mesorhizobium sp. B2-7-1]
MTRIALTTAAMLLAMGSAFAGSDHYDPNDTNRPTVGVDSSRTASIRKHEVAKQGDVDTSMTTGSAGSKAWPEPGQGIWGN